LFHFFGGMLLAILVIILAPEQVLGILTCTEWFMRDSLGLELVVNTTCSFRRRPCSTMVTDSERSLESRDTREHSNMMMYRKVAPAMATCMPHAIVDTASKPNCSTRKPEAPLDTNLPAPDKEDQRPAINP